MMRLLVLIAALFGFSTTGRAQQALDPVVLQRAIAIIADQRNAALNSQAISEAQRALADEEIARLKAHISELEKPVESGK